MTFWVLDIDIFIRWSKFTQAFSYIKSTRYQNRKHSDKQNRHIITSKHPYMWLHFIPTFVPLDSTNGKLLGTIVFTTEKIKSMWVDLYYSNPCCSRVICITIIKKVWNTSQITKIWLKGTTWINFGKMADLFDRLAWGHKP